MAARTFSRLCDGPGSARHRTRCSVGCGIQALYPCGKAGLEDAGSRGLCYKQTNNILKNDFEFGEGTTPGAKRALDGGFSVGAGISVSVDSVSISTTLSKKTCF